MLSNLGDPTLELRRHTLKVSWHLGTERNADGDKLYHFCCHAWFPGHQFGPILGGQYITYLPEDTDERTLLEASIRILDILENSSTDFQDKFSHRWKDALELFSWIRPDLLEPDWVKL